MGAKADGFSEKQKKGADRDNTVDCRPGGGDLSADSGCGKKKEGGYRDGVLERSSGSGAGGERYRTDTPQDGG